MVLARKETPTSYHLSVVVDDALQGVTHVVRGQDLYQATSVHRVLQALLGLPAPLYHHHRLILDAEGKKLSKSTRATALRELRSRAKRRPTSGASSGWNSRRYATPSGPESDMGACADWPCRPARGILSAGWDGSCVRPRVRSPPSGGARSARAPRVPARPRRALAMLAHEIRTPLNGILAMSELIAAADLPERERQWAAHVKGAAEHLAALATLVVDGVRAEKRGLVLRAELFRRARSRRNSARRLRRARKRRGSPPMSRSRTTCRSCVIGDRVRLRAALENLIDNAVKFTERGRVGLSVSAARGAARAASARASR